MAQQRLDKWFYKIVPWHGFLEEAYSCLRTEMPRIEPELAIAYSSALLGHVLHGTIEAGSTRYMTNFYLMVVGRSGTYKTVAWKVLRNQLLLDMMKDGKLNEAHTGASVEGLATELAEYRSVIHFADEVQRIFKHKKTGGYLGDIPDFWKNAWNGDYINMPRRSKSKRIVVQPGYIFTVIMTTTPEDLETVLDAIDDEALKRRFLPITTKTGGRVGEGEVADWRRLKEIIDFTAEIRPVTFIVEEPKKVSKIVDALLNSLGGQPDSWLQHLLDTYTVKFASILAYDKLIAWLISLLKRLGRLPGDTWSIPSSTDLRFALSSYTEALNRLKENPHVAIAQNSDPDTQAPVYTHAKESDVGLNNEIVQFVEDLSKKLMRVVEDLSKREILTVDYLSITPFLTVEIPYNPPKVEWVGNSLIIWVDTLEVVRGALLTLAMVMKAMSLYEYMGMNPRWAYFVRRLRELKERFDVVDMRLLARYMKKIGSYQELLDLVERAVTAGYLLPTTRISSREDMYKVQFQITISEWGE